MFKLMGNIQAVHIWPKVSYLKVSTGHTLFSMGTCVGHWPAELSCFHHCDKHLKHLPGIKGLFLLAISKDHIHGQVGLWTAFGGQWWSTITPLRARMWKKARRRNLGPTIPPRHVTNNTESTSKAHCCGGDQAFTRRDPHGCWNPKSSCFFKALSDEFMFYWGLYLNPLWNLQHVKHLSKYVCMCTHICACSLCIMCVAGVVGSLCTDNRS